MSSGRTRRDEGRRGGGSRREERNRGNGGRERRDRFEQNSLTNVANIKDFFI